jgi:23S rRNA (pseudouridine1915-N3)-methyltransferase
MNVTTVENKAFINKAAWTVSLTNMKICRNSGTYTKNEHRLSFLGQLPLTCRTGLGCDILPPMQITVAHVSTRPAKDDFDAHIQAYLKRCAGFAHCRAEGFRSEEVLLEWLGRQQGRVPIVTVLLDGRGRPMSSEIFAEWLGARRDGGAQHIVLAIGPASGWSDEARSRAQLLLSLGPFTLAHSLARLVMAEQLYRAYTILTGHPYHTGH